MLEGNAWKTLGAIVQKEIRYNILNRRFLAYICAGVALFVISTAVFAPWHKRRVAHFNKWVSVERDRANRIEARPELIRSYTVQVLDHPSELALLYSDAVGYWPDILGFKIAEPQRIRYSFTTNYNYALPRYLRFDWTFVVLFLLSFGAIALGYDAITGEREKGTLKLILSNGIPRHRILLGKYAALVIVASLALIAGILSALVVLSATLPELLTYSMLKAVGQWLCVSIALQAVYIATSIAVSAYCWNSTSSLYISLSLWIVYVVAIPSAAQLVARHMYPVPTAFEAQQEIEAIKDEGGATMNGGAESLRERITARYNHQILMKINQTRQAIILSRISPHCVAEEIYQDICNTGVGGFEARMQAVSVYASRMAEEGSGSLDLLYAGGTDALRRRPHPVLWLSRFLSLCGLCLASLLIAFWGFDRSVIR